MTAKNSLIIGLWLTAFMHPLIFPYVHQTIRSIEKWLDVKRVEWHIKKIKEIKEKYKI